MQQGPMRRSVGASLLRPEVRKSRANDVPPRYGLGFEDLVEKVRQDREVRGRRCNDIDQRLKHLRPFFRRMRARRITTEAVERYVALRLSEGAAHATINRELAVLRRALVLARLSKIPLVQSLPENNARRTFSIGQTSSGFARSYRTTSETSRLFFTLAVVPKDKLRRWSGATLTWSDA
jgi:hypothetical protein